jgi:hypothetical protein
MVEKVVYLPFTIETDEEITDRQAQIIANKARWMFARKQIIWSTIIVGTIVICKFII